MTNEVVAFFEELADHLEAVVENLPELLAPFGRVLGTRKADEKRNVERNRTDVAAADRHVLARFRILPGREVRTAPHRARDDAGLQEQFRNVAVVGRERKPVRVHALSARLHAFFKERSRPLVFLDLTFVVEVNELREDHRTTAGAVPVSAGREDDAVDFIEPFLLFLGELRIPLAEGNGREGDVAARGSHRIELQFEGLKALLKLADRFGARHLLRGFFGEPAGFLVLFIGARPGLLHIGK